MIETLFELVAEKFGDLNPTISGEVVSIRSDWRWCNMSIHDSILLQYFGNIGSGECSYPMNRTDSLDESLEQAIKDVLGV